MRRPCPVSQGPVELLTDRYLRVLKRRGIKTGRVRHLAGCFHSWTREDIHRDKRRLHSLPRRGEGGTCLSLTLLRRPDLRHQALTYGIHTSPPAPARHLPLTAPHTSLSRALRHYASQEDPVDLHLIVRSTKSLDPIWPIMLASVSLYSCIGPWPTSS